MSNVGQAAFTIVGTVVGAYFGNPQLGYTIGSLAGQAIFPTKLPGAQGPRLSDNRTTAAAVGAPVMDVIGNDAVSGNVIWIEVPPREVGSTEEVGGKGGPTQEVTTYSYTASFAVSLCEGPISGVRRIWADGKLVYDASASATGESVIGSINRVTIYPGDELQLPDATIEAYQGAGNVPAYRGQAYAVFTDLPLADYGNRIPNMSFEVVTTASTTPTLVYSANNLTGPVPAEYTGALRTGDSNGITYACMGNASSVDVYMIYPNGLAVKGGSFSKTGYLVPQGFSDEPSFATNESVFGGRVWYYLIGADGASASLVAQFRVPSGMNANFTNLGSIHKRGDYIYAYSYPSGGPYKIIKSGARTLTEAAAPVVWDGATAGLPATLEDICIGESEIYGLLVNNTLVVWDLDFNVLKTISFAPSVALGYGHFGGDETQLFSEHDGFVYLLSGGHLHGIDLRTDGYVYFGAVPLAEGYDMYGGWSVRGNLLTAYQMPTLQSTSFSQYNIAAVSPGTTTVASVVADLCSRAGLSASDYNVTALTDTVDGYAIGNPASVRSALEQLAPVYQFDAAEADTIRFVKRGGASVASIALDDLVMERGR